MKVFAEQDVQDNYFLGLKSCIITFVGDMHFISLKFLEILHV